MALVNGTHLIRVKMYLWSQDMDRMVSLVDSFIVTCSFTNNMSLVNTDFQYLVYELWKEKNEAGK
jgi:hypothetical protein